MSRIVTRYLVAKNFYVNHSIIYSLLAYGLLAIGIVLMEAGCTRTTIDVQEFVPPQYPPPPDKARFIYEKTLRSSFDVKQMTSMDKLKQFATGSAGIGIGLSKPYGIAVYHGKIYVTDTVSRQVILLDSPAQDSKKIGSEGDGALVKPIGISIDKVNQRLYVADNTAKRVVAYDLDGNFIRAFGGADLLRRPTGVAASADGKLVYVVDTGGVDSQAHHVYIFDSETSELLRTVGTRGKEAGQFNLPLQVATAANGLVYVVDGGNFRIQVFTREGEYLRSFGSIGNQSGQFSRPKGIAVGPDGNIYVVDTGFGNFQIFDPNGQLLTFVGQKGNVGTPGEFLLPAGIAVDDDGRVYMADQFFRKIEVFRPADLLPEQGYLNMRINKSAQQPKS